MGQEHSKQQRHHAPPDSASTAAATASEYKQAYQQQQQQHDQYTGTPLYIWINKKKFTIPRNISPQMSLNTYLRDVIDLTGTKVMCSEGGCGACLVHVTKPAPVQHQGAEQQDVSVDVATKCEEFSVNSCLTPLLSCAGWHITTIEGIGNTAQPHDVQKRMEEHSGTQCGYCTPGFCMQQYSVLRSNACCKDSTNKKAGVQGALNETEMWENAFDGNICRCTGYRPILDAAKSFVKHKPNKKDLENLAPGTTKTDAQKKTSSSDIEDLAFAVGTQRNIDRAFAFRSGEDSNSGQNMWYTPVTFEQFWQIIDGYASTAATIRFVAGNTAEGIYRSAVPYNVYIDIKRLPNLSNSNFHSTHAEFGALTTLATLINEFETSSDANFGYLKQIAAHWRRVASNPVRNMATWAGSLMLKYEHPDFPSDVTTLLAAVHAKVEVLTSTDGAVRQLTIPELLQQPEGTIGRTQLVTKLILFPLPPDEFIFCSFKVTPREQNAHAHMNAAFLFPIQRSDAVITLRNLPTITYGCVNPHFLYAHKTAESLRGAGSNIVQLLSKNGGKNLLAVFQALQSESELSTVDEYEKGKAEYRRRLMRNLLYKALVFAASGATSDEAAKDVLGYHYHRDEKNAKRIKNSNNLLGSERLQTAWQRIDRPISSGKQDIETVKTDYPLTKPMPKIEALMQTTGQLQYTSDLHLHNQLYAAPILSPVAHAKLLGLSTEEAERVPGFVRIITSADIPGTNSCTCEPLAPETLFVDINKGQIDYAGQPVGLVLAETAPQAEAISKLVVVQYELIDSSKPPLLTCDDAIRENSFHPNKLVGEKNEIKVGDIEKGFKSSTFIAEGEVRMDQQFHFHMETQVAVAEPTNNGNTLTVHAGTQWPDHVLSAVAQVCKMNAGQIDVITRPIGGSYGAKITRNMPVSCMAALGAVITRRPVKLHMSLWDNMRMLGCRYEYFVKYKVGVGADHKLKAVHLQTYCNMGANPNDYGAPFSNWGDNAYKCENWLIEPKIVKTNITPMTHTRAPGSVEATFFIETVMEHAAQAARIDPFEFRRRNFYKNGDWTLHEDRQERDGMLKDVQLENCTEELLQRIGSYAVRKQQVEEFNANNRWKKRGFSIVPLKYACNYTLVNHCAQVSIHHVDASVIIAHAGVEIGQGINTKAAQTAAYMLGAPLEKVHVKPTMSLTSVGALMTGASLTSEMIGYSVEQACKELKERMAQVPASKLAAAVAAGSAKAVMTGDPSAATPWAARVAAANLEGMDLTARYWINGLKWSGGKKDALAYNAYGCTYCEVELDVLTGERQVRRLEVVEDVGQSLSPVVDIGQVEGAIVMGLGLYMSEHYERDKKTGQLLTYRTWEYKPPSSKDIPAEFNVTFLKNVPNKLGMQRSKLIGEPPLLMSCSVIFALQHAVRAARKELGISGAGDNNEWIELGSPATCEKLQLLCDVQAEHLAAGAV